MQSITDALVKIKRPIQLVQFGEGNFLRAFVDYMVDIANEKDLLNSGIAIVKPILAGNLDALAEQDGMYTVLLRGKQSGETVSLARAVTSVRVAVDAYAQYEQYAALATLDELRFIVSNTTEAGIVYDPADDFSFAPPVSFPGKLTKFLFTRYEHFDGDGDRGVIVLPVELIENNGGVLLECCVRLAARWGLPSGFIDWLNNACVFCSTLVDRIVTGYPKDEAAAIEAELGYADQLLVAGEPFALWVIESADYTRVQKAFSLDKAGMPVVFTNDLRPYRERKVRLLNGAHTSTVLAAYLSGLDTVGELMNDKSLRRLIEKNVYDELSPNVDLPAAEVRAFADSVMERFENPFIRHSLLAISLNSVSKFKARVLPSIKDTCARTGRLPDGLCFSLAALMAFYSGTDGGAGTLTAKRGEESYEISDDASVLAFFAAHCRLDAAVFVEALLKRTDFWGEDLSLLPGLIEKTAGYLTVIREKGMRAAVEELPG